MSKELITQKQIAKGRVYRIVPSDEVRKVKNDEDPRIGGLFVRGITLESAQSPKEDRPSLGVGSRIGSVYISSVAIQYPHHPKAPRVNNKPWKVGTHTEPNHHFDNGIEGQVTERWVGLTVGRERARGKGTIDGKTGKIRSRTKPQKDANPEYYVVFKKNGRVKRVVGIVGKKQYLEKIHVIEPGTKHSSKVKRGAVFAIKTVEETERNKKGRRNKGEGN